MHLDTLLQYKASAAVLMTLVGWPVISAVLNVMLRRKTAAQWEAWAKSRPATAFGVELLRAFGVDPSKALVAAQRYAQRKAGDLPADAASAPGLPPTVAALLADPVKRELLEEVAKRLATGSSELPQPEPQA